MSDKDLDAEAKNKDASTKIKDSMPNWVASLGVAAMLVIALQLTFVFQPNHDEVITPEIINSLPAAITEPHWVLLFTFEPNAKWRDISKTLASIKGVIIDGPSSKGFVRVAIARETTDLNESKALLKRLNTQADVVSVFLEE